jgi:hypothetical protein
MKVKNVMFGEITSRNLENHILPPSSGANAKPSKNPEEAGRKFSLANRLLLWALCLAI